MRVFLLFLALTPGAVHANTTLGGNSVTAALAISSIAVYNVGGSTMAVNASSASVTSVGSVAVSNGPDGVPRLPVESFTLSRFQEEEIALLREISSRLLYLIDAAGKGYGRKDVDEKQENK